MVHVCTSKSISASELTATSGIPCGTHGAGHGRAAQWGPTGAGRPVPAEGRAARAAGHRRRAAHAAPRPVMAHVACGAAPAAAARAALPALPRWPITSTIVPAQSRYNM